MPSLGPMEIVLIILVIAILFGWSKLPDAARSLGRSMRIFKSEVEEMKRDKPSEASRDTVPGTTVPPAQPQQPAYQPPQAAHPQYQPPQAAPQQAPYVPPPSGQPQQAPYQPQPGQPAYPPPQYQPPADPTAPPAN